MNGKWEITFMNEKRAQEIIKHIIEDKDNGAKMLKTSSLSDSIYIVSEILPDCIKKANELGKDTDANYFSQMLDLYHPIVLDKIKNADRLWILYCDTTGYPYQIDKDMLVLFDYTHHKDVLQQLERAGFKITVVDMKSDQFKNEVGHMYRNGYQSIHFIDGKCIPFIVDREELYTYDEFFGDEYITNPALQQTMISFFQEFRKDAELDLRMKMIESRQEKMIQNLLHAEFMVPCTKTETDEEVEISHPYIDLSDRVETEDDEPVIAIPAFTDGFELEKCYNGKHETMLYNFQELVKLVDELGASGIIINCMGVSYYMDQDVIKKILR